MILLLSWFHHRRNLPKGARVTLLRAAQRSASAGGAQRRPLHIVRARLGID
jgi:hypothetical protein